MSSRAEASNFTPLSIFMTSSAAGKRKTPYTSSSKDLSLLSCSFHDNLHRRLKALNPPSLSFAWLARAVHLLAATHADAAEVIANQSRAALPGNLEKYLDESVKVLDVCNSVSSDIENLLRGRLLVHYVIRVLDGSTGSEEKEDGTIRCVRECIVDCQECFTGGRSEKGRRHAEAAGLLLELSGSLVDPLRGKKIATAEKAVRQVLYAVRAVSMFVLGVVVAVLEGSSPLPIATTVPVHGECGFSWAGEFNGLQSTVLGEIRRRRRRLGGEKRVLVDEMEELEERLRSVSGVLLGNENDGVVKAERVRRGCVRKLERATEEMSEGLDHLLNGVNGFFRRVLWTRSVLLDQIREEC